MEVNGYKIKLGADLSAVKMKKITQSLVVTIVFLAGCSASGSSSTTTTVTTDVATTVTTDVATTVAQARKACANKRTGVMRYIAKGSCNKKTESLLS